MNVYMKYNLRLQLYETSNDAFPSAPHELPMLLFVTSKLHAVWPSHKFWMPYSSPWLHLL
jgi:hypothetical protein